MLITRLLESERVQLFRAIQTKEQLNIGDPYVLDVRQDRRPRDSYAPFAMMFEYGIEKSLGVRNIRRRALFSATDIGIADQYGTTILELHPPETAVAVYNPKIYDSAAITSAADEKHNSPPVISELQEVIEEIIQLRTSHYGQNQLVSLREVENAFMNVSWYLSEGDHLMKYQQKIKSLIDWDYDGLSEFLEKAGQLFIRASEWMAQGYIKTSVSQLPAGGYEVMLVDISKCDAVVLST